MSDREQGIVKFLVTGGAGFLGAWISKRLLAGGHAVRVLDRSADDHTMRAIAGDGVAAVEWRTGDVSKTEDVVRASEGCDGIAHLAALLTPACLADPVLGANVNLIGTINVFEAAKAHGMRQVAYASSAGVFGPVDGIMPRPTTLYGAFKLACEGCARAYAGDHGIASVGFRPLVVYGPGREIGGSAGPSLACRAAAENRPYTIPITGKTDLIFVDDVAAAFEAALLRKYDGAHVFNLRGSVATIDQVIAAITALVPGAALTAAGAPLPVAAEIEAHDPSVVLGRLPVTALNDGLRRTIEFYQHPTA
jgi:nucleoside-diphosphate-sugar epimerase